MRADEKRWPEHRLKDFSDPSKLWATERKRNGKDAYQPPAILREPWQQRPHPVLSAK